MTLRLLVAVDVEHPESWIRVRDALARLAPAGAAELHVLYVLPEIGSALVGAALPEGFERAALERAAGDLAALLADHPAGPGLPTPVPHVAHGPVDGEILAAGRRLEAGLLALHAPGHGPVDRALGTHALSVAGACDRPVLLVPGPAAD